MIIGLNRGQAVELYRSVRRREPRCMPGHRGWCQQAVSVDRGAVNPQEGGHCRPGQHCLPGAACGIALGITGSRMVIGLRRNRAGRKYYLATIRVQVFSRESRPRQVPVLPSQVTLLSLLSWSHRPAIIPGELARSRSLARQLTDVNDMTMVPFRNIKSDDSTRCMDTYNGRALTITAPR